MPDRWETRCCHSEVQQVRGKKRGKMNFDRLCTETYAVYLEWRLTDPGVGFSAHMVDHRGIVTSIGGRWWDGGVCGRLL